MLKKEIDTDFGIAGKFWKVTGFAYSLEEKRGFIELKGFATETALKPIGKTQVAFGSVGIEEIIEIEVEFVYTGLVAVLEKIVEESEDWKNIN